MTNPTSRPWRGALIGCGYVAQFHLHGWRRQPDVHIQAVCDLDRARAAALGSAFGVAGRYDDPARMLAEEDLDFVEICTRPASHEALVELAARRRRAILCQKPLAPDLATIDRMIATCAAAGVRMMVHENWRFRPWYLRMAEELAAGRIGRPVRLRVDAHDFRCLAPGGIDDQPYFRAMPRFILFEMGPHLVDVARHLFGDPADIHCVTAKAGSQAGEDSAHLVLHYADGRLAILDMCWSTASHADDRLAWGLYHTVVEGTLATLSTTGDGRLRLVCPDAVSQELSVSLDPDPRIQSYALTQRHFLDRLADGRPFATDLADNRRAMAIILAGYHSALGRRVVSFDEAQRLS